MKDTAQASQEKMGVNQRKIRDIEEHYKQVPHTEVFLLTCRLRLLIFYTESIKE
jgi:hypothetical protein